MSRILLEAGSVRMEAELNETDSARAIFESLPITAKAQTWGDEIYFSIPVKLDEEDAQAEVPSGTLGYWPPGNAFCIFFGQTPASPVNVVGKLLGTPTDFRTVSAGTPVTISAVSP